MGPPSAGERGSPGDLLERLGALSPDAEQLLIGASVFREPADRNALLFHVGEHDWTAAGDGGGSGPAPPYRAPAGFASMITECAAAGLLIVVSQPDERRDHGDRASQPGHAGSVGRAGAGYQERSDNPLATVAPAVELRSWLVPGQAPGPGAAAVAAGPLTVQAAPGVADALSRTLVAADREDDVIQAHAHAAEYWRWRAAAWPQSRADVHDLLEGRHHLLTSGEITQACDITDVVSGQLHAWGDLDREAALINDMLDHLPARSVRRGGLLHALGNIAVVRQDYAGAELDYRRALRVYAEAGHRQGVSRCHHGLGMLAQVRGDYTEAELCYQRAAATALSAPAGSLEAPAGVLPVETGLATSEPASHRPAGTEANTQASTGPTDTGPAGTGPAGTGTTHAGPGTAPAGTRTTGPGPADRGAASTAPGGTGAASTGPADTAPAGSSAATVAQAGLVPAEPWSVTLGSSSPGSMSTGTLSTDQETAWPQVTPQPALGATAATPQDPALPATAPPATAAQRLAARLEAARKAGQRAARQNVAVVNTAQQDAAKQNTAKPNTGKRNTAKRNIAKRNAAEQNAAQQNTARQNTADQKTARRAQRKTARQRTALQETAQKAVQQRAAESRRTATHRRRVRRRRLLCVASACAAVVALATAQLTGLLPPNGAARGPDATAALVRRAAAVWVARQVSRSAIIACDPAMCTALRTQGVAGGNLLALGTGAGDPLGSDVVIASSAVRSLFGSRLSSVYAPVTLAAFGHGNDSIEVRVTAADGSAAYRRALAADVAARKQAGAALLGNNHLQADAAVRAQLAAGHVDARMIMTLVSLVGIAPIRVLSFGKSAPGATAGLPLVSVVLTTVKAASVSTPGASPASTGAPSAASSGGATAGAATSGSATTGSAASGATTGGAASGGATPGGATPARTAASGTQAPALSPALKAMLEFLHGQQPPYLAAAIDLIELSSGQAGLAITFASPSPLGLLPEAHGPRPPH